MADGGRRRHNPPRKAHGGQQAMQYFGGRAANEANLIPFPDEDPNVDPCTDKLFAHAFGFKKIPFTWYTVPAWNTSRQFIKTKIYRNNDGARSRCGCNAVNGQKCHTLHCQNLQQRIVCPLDCGDGCSNQKFIGEWDLSQSLSLHGTAEYGMCLRAERFIEAGTVFLEYAGIMKTGIAGPEVLHFQRLVDRRADQELYVDASQASNYSRLIPYDENPNCQIRSWIVGFDIRLMIEAKEDIQVGGIPTLPSPSLHSGLSRETSWGSHTDLAGERGGKYSPTSKKNKTPDRKSKSKPSTPSSREYQQLYRSRRHHTSNPSGPDADNDDDVDDEPIAHCSTKPPKNPKHKKY